MNCEHFMKKTNRSHFFWWKRFVNFYDLTVVGYYFGTFVRKQSLMIWTRYGNEALNHKANYDP